MDYVEENIINFEKVLLMGDILTQITRFQSSGDYSKILKGRHSLLLRYLTNLKYFDEKKLEELSIAIKPLPAGMAEELSNSLDSFGSSSFGEDSDSSSVTSDGNNSGSGSTEEGEGEEFEELENLLGTSNEYTDDDMYAQYFME